MSAHIDDLEAEELRFFVEDILDDETDDLLFGEYSEALKLPKKKEPSQ